MKKSKEKNFSLVGLLNKIFLVLLVTLFGYFIIAQLSTDSGQLIGEATYEEFKSDWVRIMNDGSEVPVEVPGILDVDRQVEVTIETRLPDEVPKEFWLCFHSNHQDMQIYIDGHLRENYSTKEQKAHVINTSSAYVFVEVQREDAGGVLRVSTLTDSKYTGTISEVYMGDRYGIWMNFAKASVLDLAWSVILLVLALVVVVIGVVLQFWKKASFPIIYLGFAVGLCACWIISESQIRQLIFPDITSIGESAFFALMLIPAAFAMYMNEIQGKRFERLYGIYILINLSNDIRCIFLHYTGREEFLSLLNGILNILLSLIVLVAYTLIRDFQTGHAKEYRPIIIAAGAMVIGGLAEIYMALNLLMMNVGGILCLALVIILSAGVYMTVKDLVSLERQNEEAVLTSISQKNFLSSMSHEIRTPVNSIVGMNEMILRENQDPAITNYALYVDNAGKLLLGLITDILDYSAIETGTVEVLEEDYYVAEAVDAVVRVLEERTKNKELKFYCTVSEELPRVLRGDGIRLRQILMNLVTNAVKHTKQGQIVMAIDGDMIEDGSYVIKCTIADNGDGLEEKNIRISRTVAELMGGELKVERAEGHGSYYTLSMPQMLVDATPIGKEYEQLRNGGARKYMELFHAPKARVLVIDDNQANQKVISDLLKNTEIQLDIANGRKPAFELLAHNTYHLIMMEPMLREYDGVEILRTIRGMEGNANQNIPVIALTANAVAGAKQKYLGLGFDGYLEKPIHIGALEHTLKSILPEELVTLVEYEENNEKKEELFDIYVANEVSNEDETDNDSQSAEHDTTDIIDKAVGYKYCMNDETFYCEVLESYIENGNERLTDLARYYEDKDLKDYGIVAHAIKSTSLTIGAVQFSEMAKTMEYAAKEGKADAVWKQYPIFVENYRLVLGEAERMLGEARGTSEAEPEADSEEPLQEQLTESGNNEVAEESGAMQGAERKEAYMQLIERVHNYEMQEVYDEIGLLEKGASEEEVQLLNKVRQCVDEFDYDSAEEALKEWLEA